MTIEEKLKDYILSNYKSIREFVQIADIPYTTMDGILKRGIGNASIGNVLKICKALKISADELGNGKIVPFTEKNNSSIDLRNYVNYVRNNLLDFKASIDGKELTIDEYHVVLDGIELSIEMIKRNRKRKENDERFDSKFVQKERG